MVLDHAMQCPWNIGGKTYANGRDLLLIDHLNLSVVNVQWNDTEVTFLMSIQPPLNIEKPLELLSQKPWMYAGRWKLTGCEF